MGTQDLLWGTLLLTLGRGLNNQSGMVLSKYFTIRRQMQMKPGHFLVLPLRLRRVIVSHSSVGPGLLRLETTGVERNYRVAN
jgi:hypothetical protein